MHHYLERSGPTGAFGHVDPIALNADCHVARRADSGSAIRIQRFGSTASSENEETLDRIDSREPTGRAGRQTTGERNGRPPLASTLNTAGYRASASHGLYFHDSWRAALSRSLWLPPRARSRIPEPFRSARSWSVGGPVAETRGAAPLRSVEDLADANELRAADLGSNSASADERWRGTRGESRGCRPQ